MNNRRSRAIAKKTARRQLRPETKMLIKQGLLGALIMLGLGLLIAGIWYSTRVHVLTLTEITITGGQTVAHDTVRTQVESVLDGVYFRLVPKRFAWLYPQSAIVDAIKTIERIDNVQVERLSGTELSVVYDEYKPYALWCPEDVEQACLFIDRSGYAFATAPLLKGESFVRFVTLGTEPQLRDKLAERSTLRNIDWFMEQLKRELGLYIVSVEIDLVGDVFYTLSGGGELKASINESKEHVFANLQTILASDEFAHIEPGNFKYIDLRFGNKVFVNEELAVPEEGTASGTATSTVDQ